MEMGRGVRQGPPILLNHCRERLTKKVFGGDLGIRGRKSNTIKYADDLFLLAKKNETVQDILDSLVVIKRKYDTQINIEKFKVMGMSNKFVWEQTITKFR